jgi:hypothetical protein
MDPQARFTQSYGSELNISPFCLEPRARFRPSFRTLNEASFQLNSSSEHAENKRRLSQ